MGTNQVLYSTDKAQRDKKTWVMDTCCGIANTCIFCSQTPSPFNDETAICQMYFTFVIELYLLWLLFKSNYSFICLTFNSNVCVLKSYNISRLCDHSTNDVERNQQGNKQYVQPYLFLQFCLENHDEINQF